MARNPRVADANELVHQHLGLVAQAVASVSARYPRHVDRQELWNAGALGLVEAAHRFDPATGTPFAHYATMRIRGAIIDSTRSCDWASRSVRRRARELAQVREEMTRPDGRAPQDDALALALGITVDELGSIEARSAASTPLYLDHDTGITGPSLRDTISDPSPDADPLAVLEEREMLGTLREAMHHIPGIHGEVIRRSYLDGELLQSIADDHGVTAARISQIRSEALAALQTYFGALYDTVPQVADNAPGKRVRASFIATLAAQSTWLSRLQAAAPSMPAWAVGA